LWSALAVPFLPLFANSFGWIFTEMGRQPWSVFGLMTTARSVSPNVSPFEAMVSLVALTALYGVLAFIEVRLMVTYIHRGADELPAPPNPDDESEDRPLAFAY
jgi:cytochrome d ubiquinol oxidase subunit I